MQRPGVLAAISLALSLGALSGCTAEVQGAAPKRPVEQVEIRPLAPELFVGQRLLLEALPTDRNGEDLGTRPTVWASSDESVATVTIGGLVEGMAPGEARISATIEGVEGSVDVTVGPTPLGRVAGGARVVRAEHRRQDHPEGDRLRRLGEAGGGDFVRLALERPRDRPGR